MKLSEFLKETTPTAFAKEHNIPIPVITRFLKGERGLSAKTMHKIELATQGRVTVHELIADLP